MSELNGGLLSVGKISGIPLVEKTFFNFDLVIAPNEVVQVTNSTSEYLEY